MRIGILGGGQLARMLALAGYPLGLSFRCLDPAEDPCAADVMPHIRGAWDDADALRLLVKDVDLVTFETENIPLRTLDYLEAWGIRFQPNRTALRLTQDRLLEKNFLVECGISTAPFAAVESLEEALQAIAKIPYPVVLKTRRLGYDGKGQQVARNQQELEKALQILQGQELIMEGFVAFEAEGSLIAVRDAGGRLAFYPLVRNEHRKGILFRTEAWVAPGLIDKVAREAMSTLMSKMQYVGTMALEFFSKKGQLIANELAPRVHNSGHWTIEAAATSQFENHLRAITGLPLGSTAVRAPFRMLNFIGHMPAREDILRFPIAHLHDYHKVPAPGRKLGHVTLVSDDREDIERTWEEVIAISNS